MNYTTVYEVVNEQLDSTLFIPLIFIIVGFGISYVSYKFLATGSSKRSYTIGFGILFGLFALVFSLMTIPSSLIDYRKTMKAYEEGNYKTEIGKIENFEPMPFGGHQQEKFTLNGIEFDYSDFSLSHYGFHNSASHGGPIKENGQEVKIGYITSENGKNIIWKIELNE
jgi:predicted membrane protein